jgi:mono/diheme cytochrome c family protein
MNIRQLTQRNSWRRVIALCAVTVCVVLSVPVTWRNIVLRDAVAATAPQTAAASDSLRFVEHPDTYPIAWPSTDRPLLLTNPFENSANALATGAQLYVAYNCVDCHGAGGGGSMGPSLADGRWHFGGRSGEVFESIYQGRPDGMPAWGGRISNEQIWMLVLYVRSLNGGRDVSTDNFTGRTIERTGH